MGCQIQRPSCKSAISRGRHRVLAPHRIGSAAAIWRSEFETSVWPLLVEVVDVDAEDMLELAATEDQEPVEALPADAADPALRVGVRVRRAVRRADDLDVFALEDAVEGAAELRVAIVDQEARPLAALVEIHQQVARLLRHPGRVRVARACEVLDPAGADRDEEQHVQPPQPDRLDGEEIAGQHRLSVPSEERAPAGWSRPGAGGMPERASTFRTSVAETLIPSLRNSPTIRTYPQWPFSRASRRINSRTSGPSRGRPGRRCGYVQWRAMIRRCQPNSVSGVTGNACHDRRGSTRLSATSTSRSRAVSCGRRVCRRRIASSCRSRTISSSFEPSLRRVTARVQKADRQRRRQTTQAQAASEDGAVDATALATRSNSSTAPRSRSDLCTPRVPFIEGVRFLCRRFTRVVGRRSGS